MLASDNRARKWLFRLVSGAILLGFLLWQRQTALQFFQTLRAVPIPLILAAVAFYLAGQWLCAWKWAILLGARGLVTPISTCARIYLAGMFANLFLPSNIGGDALRAALLHQERRIAVTDALASIVVERLTGFAALLVLAIGGLLARGAGQNGGWRLVFGVMSAFFVMALLAFLIFQVSHPKIQNLRAALAFYLQKSHRAALMWALILSLVFQASQVLLNWGLARAVGLNVAALDFWWLGPLLSLSGLLPIGIGGLGVREVAAVTFLPNFERGIVVVWSLLWQATVALSSLPGALWVRNAKT